MDKLTMTEVFNIGRDYGLDKQEILSIFLSNPEKIYPSKIELNLCIQRLMVEYVKYYIQRVLRIG